MVKKLYFLIALILLLCTPKIALALPSLQVYIPGSTAGTSGADENTWFANVLPGAFQLYVVGSYGPNDTAITNGTLLATVPQGQIGNINISSLGLGTPHPDLSFLPATGTVPELHHYPLNKPDLFDFYTFDIGSFAQNVGLLHDYNADGGSIGSKSNAVGEQKIFNLTVTGFEYVHFDAYAKFNNDDEDWRANRGSHDSTAKTLEPATLSLLGLGLFGFGAFRRKRKDMQT